MKNLLPKSKFLRRFLAIVILLSVAKTYCKVSSHHKINALETKVQELKTLNNKLIEEVILLNTQKKAARNHMDHCAWIAKDQIVAVNGSHGHWLQLDLNQPGYTLK